MMMDTVLKLYYADSNGAAHTFPYGMEQARLRDFTVSKTRMGGAPTITATLEYPVCLDSEWTARCAFDDVFVTFHNERYYLKATPSSTKSNDKLFYRHELSLECERAVLSTVYFIDDVENQTADTVYSNNTKFTFFGNIAEFAERLNQSMYFSGVGDTCVYRNGQLVPVGQRTQNGDGYYAVVDQGVDVSDEKLVSVSDATIADALKQAPDRFGVPYYFTGRTIHFGEYRQVSSRTYAVDGILGAAVSEGTLVPYEYGHPNSILNVTRSNTTKNVYNRCTGTGSSDNIPYYYPNPTPTGTIRLVVTPQSGSPLSESDVTVADPMRFSNLGSDDALVYAVNDTSYEDHLVARRILVDGNPYNGRGFYVDFPYDESASEYHGVTVIVKVELEIPKEYHNITVNFGTDLPTTTFWTLVRPDGVEIKGFGRYCSVNHARLLSGGVFVTGLYKLYVEKKCEPSDPYEQGAWFDLDGMMECMEASDPYLWFGLHNGTTKNWTLLSSGNAVDIADYGLSVGDGIVPVDGDRIVKVVDSWVTPQPNLMPPCYRLSGGTKRFYPAQNYPLPASDYTPDPAIGDVVDGTSVGNANYEDDGVYYVFGNPYRRLRQREHIYQMDDIKPTIEGMVNAWGNRIDMFVAFAYDLGDDNGGYYDGNGNFIYNHPYFFALMRPTDGPNGFNLFDQAIDEAEMTVSMTSGHCAPCEFVIAVDKDTKKNLVQCNEDLQLLRDPDGNVRCGRNGAETPLPSQNDTRNNYTWIALKKDLKTYGEMMPYNKDGVEIRPTACSDLDSDDGDTFVLLHIRMPQAYVEAAEERLAREVVRMMHEDNSEKHSLSLKYSRAFLGENQALVLLLDENVKVSARYDGIGKNYLVSSYTYRMQPSSPMPEITIGGLVETTEELSQTSRSAGGFADKVAGRVADTFSERMIGNGRPLTVAINNTVNEAVGRSMGGMEDDVKAYGYLSKGSVVVGGGDIHVQTLANGTEGQVLSMVGGSPAWSAAVSTSVYYGTCASLTNANVRVCTVEAFPLDGNGKPLVGTAIAVKFLRRCLSSDIAMLNVNGTGQTRIWADGMLVGSGMQYYAGHVAGGVIHYVYNGTYWVFAGFDGNYGTRLYTIKVVSGHNGVHSLCALDWQGRLSAFTVEAGLGSKTLYNYDLRECQGFQFGFPVMCCVTQSDVAAGVTYTKMIAFDEGVFDVRYLSLMGDQLPDTWATEGDDVYLAVSWFSSKMTVIPTAVPTLVEPPYGFRPDIVVSRSMFADPVNIRKYCTNETEGMNNHYVNYVYLGRCVGGYDVRLERSHPMYRLHYQSDLQDVQWFMMPWDWRL